MIKGRTIKRYNNHATCYISAAADRQNIRELTTLPTQI